MKNRIEDSIPEETGEVMATFGDARLLKVKDAIHLEGGSMADRMEALEWMVMFMPEAVPGISR